MNLAQSGYHMLMILSVVDGKYQVAEGKVIVNYLTKNYESEIDIDKENQAILAVPNSWSRRMWCSQTESTPSNRWRHPH